MTTLTYTNDANTNINHFCRSNFETFKAQVHHNYSIKTVKAICDKRNITSKDETLQEFARNNNLEMTAKATKAELIRRLFESLQ